MNRSFWITLTLSVAICGFVIMTQVKKNDRLSQRLASHPSAMVVDGAELDRKTLAREVEQQAPKKETSSERIDRAVAVIGALKVTIMGTYNQWEKERKASDLALIPLLEAAKDLSFDELVAVANATSDKIASEYLLLLAAEEDPMSIYRNEEWRAQLSSKDLADALTNSISPAEVFRLFPEKKHKARTLAATRLMANDIESGLKALLEVNDYMVKNPDQLLRGLPVKDFGSASVTDLPAGTIPELLTEMRKPEYAAIKKDLLRMAVKNLISQGGVEKVIEQTEALQFTNDAWVAVDMIEYRGGLENNPVAVADWVSQIAPERLSRTMKKWAALDQKAAADWLVQQEPSLMRDKAIATFAKEAAKLDLDAATVWVSEINDPALQEQALRELENK